jgi:hypothetical protein
MEFFKTLDPKKQKTLKILGAVVAGVIVLAALTTIIRPSSYGPMMYGGGVASVAPQASGNFGVSYESADGYSSSKMANLSARNVMPPSYGGTTGNDAEAFEVTDYNATIETNDLDGTCGTIADLKSKSYVIFENSNTSERNCSYTFKVKKANVAEALSVLKDLDPKELNENTYTIKEQVKDYTSQAEILQKKLVAIDETLKKALAAYDEITTIATRANDAGSLAKIIDSKVGIIERLTQQRIDVSTQLDYISRAKADQLDRLDYTRFYVSVYENKYIDGRNIKDSWKQAVRDFVYNVNMIVQKISIGLVQFALLIVQFIIYILIILVVAKYGWRFVRGFWKR